MSPLSAIGGVGIHLYIGHSAVLEGAGASSLVITLALVGAKVWHIDAGLITFTQAVVVAIGVEAPVIDNFVSADQEGPWIGGLVGDGLVAVHSAGTGGASHKGCIGRSSHGGTVANHIVGV